MLWSERTVFPLKTVTASLPVLVTAMVAVWSTVSTIATERGQAAMAVLARAATARMLKAMVSRGL